MKKLVKLTNKEYLDRQLATAQTILPVLLGYQSIDFISDVRKRGSVIYNSVAMAGEVLKEVGFTTDEIQESGGDLQDRTAIRKLSELLGSDSEEGDEKKKTPHFEGLYLIPCEQCIIRPYNNLLAFSHHPLS